jgi:hypothetical protein
MKLYEISLSIQLLILLTSIIFSASFPHKYSQRDEVIFEILTSVGENRAPTIAERAREEIEYCHNFIQGMKSNPTYKSSLIVSDPRLYATLHLSKQALRYPGDFVETGVYKGGTSAIMMKVLMTLDDKGRKFYACDSYAGLPEADALDGDNSFGHSGGKGGFAFSLQDYIANLKEWKTYDEKVIVIEKGYFNETLPKSAVQKIGTRLYKFLLLCIYYDSIYYEQHF